MKSPLACTKGAVPITTCLPSRPIAPIIPQIVASVVRLWATNFGSPVVPEVASSSAGASVSGSGSATAALFCSNSIAQGRTRGSVTGPPTTNRAGRISASIGSITA
jgi:hypothetical protein